MTSPPGDTRPRPRRRRFFPKSVARVLRYLSIYGLRRTLYKIAGRRRGSLRWLRPRPARRRDIAVLGCGQYAFATIGCIVARHAGNRFVDCYDPDGEAQATFADFYGIPEPSGSAAAVIANPSVQLLYVASNHASHTDYAIEALALGKDVYCEKPISVSMDQARRLFRAVREARSRFDVGYNRPFSRAVRDLREASRHAVGPVTLGCFVVGHFLPDDHWYRRPGEGTRICGNVGHWIDLAVHVLRWSSRPDEFHITLAWSDDRARDDNLSITLTTPRGDLVTIVLTARAEPFEGIRESIHFQQGEVLAEIDDFRAMVIRDGDGLVRRRYWPKDVGHVAAITQPFRPPSRDWTEVELSTLLMLRIAAMVRGGERESKFISGHAIESVYDDRTSESELTS